MLHFLTGKKMRKVNTNPELEKEIDYLYVRISDLLKERGLSWSKLAIMCGLNRRTIVSMRTQRINPSWTTMVKIANALDVSLDELTGRKDKQKELYELYWAIPRLLPDPDNQGMVCRQALMLAQSASDSINGKETTHILLRRDICKEEAKSRFKAAVDSEKAKGNKEVDDATESEDKDEVISLDGDIAVSVES